MFSLRNLFISLLVILQSAWARAEISPNIGAKVAVAAAQDLLTSPPLPSLENGGAISVSPQLGYTMAKVSGSVPLSEVSVDSRYSGNLNGFSGGLGISWPPKGRFGWFAMIGGNSLSGQITIKESEEIEEFASTTEFKDLKSQVLAGVAGASYRFIGDANSPFSMGAFLGPAFMTVNSSFTLVNAEANFIGDYELNTNIYGAYTGLQVKYRYGKFLINPYALYFTDLSEECREFQKGNVGNVRSAGCKENSIPLAASFPGYGIFIGYGNLRLNVYSKALQSKDYNEIKITNYAISYSF